MRGFILTTTTGGVAWRVDFFFLGEGGFEEMDFGGFGVVDEVGELEFWCC